MGLKQLPAEGFVRVSQFVGPGKAIPVGRTTWWRGVRDGIFPKPVRLGPNITAWRVEDIRALVSKAGE
jgi:prophage regulatory protein